MMGKRIGLLLSSEEIFPTVSAGIAHQLQEYGVGNARGDVEKDPSLPLLRAREFGRALFTLHATDYTIDAPRSGRVWS